MSCSLSIAADSSKRAVLIHEGTSQCSLGMTSTKMRDQYTRIKDDRTGSFTVMAFCLCLSLRLDLKFVCEFDVVEECPGVIELMVPRSLKILHCLDHPQKLIIPDQRK